MNSGLKKRIMIYDVHTHTHTHVRTFIVTDQDGRGPKETYSLYTGKRAVQLNKSRLQGIGKK